MVVFFPESMKLFDHLTFVIVQCVIAPFKISRKYYMPYLIEFLRFYNVLQLIKYVLPTIHS
jgi:hypothetical protein